MQIVIDILEEDYERVVHGRIPVARMRKAIRNGTILPKGHGRLIDADKLKEELKTHRDFYVNAYRGFKNLSINDKSRVNEISVSIASVVNSPTIIEADKAESEG